MDDNIESIVASCNNLLAGTIFASGVKMAVEIDNRSIPLVSFPMTYEDVKAYMAHDPKFRKANKYKEIRVDIYI